MARKQEEHRQLRQQQLQQQCLAQQKQEEERRRHQQRQLEQQQQQLMQYQQQQHALAMQQAAEQQRQEREQHAQQQREQKVDCHHHDLHLAMMMCRPTCTCFCPHYFVHGNTVFVLTELVTTVRMQMDDAQPYVPWAQPCVQLSSLGHAGKAWTVLYWLLQQPAVRCFIIYPCANINRWRLQVCKHT